MKQERERVKQERERVKQEREREKRERERESVCENWLSLTPPSFGVGSREGVTSMSGCGVFFTAGFWLHALSLTLTLFLIHTHTHTHTLSLAHIDTHPCSLPSRLRGHVCHRPSIVYLSNEGGGTYHSFD